MKRKTQRKNAPLKSNLPKNRTNDPRSFVFPNGLGGLFVVGIGASILILLAVYLWPVGELPEESVNRVTDSHSSGIPPEEPQQSKELTQATVSGEKPSPGRGDMAPVSFALPTPQVSFDVPTEQTELLNAIEKASKQLPMSPKIWHVAGLVYTELLQSNSANLAFQKAVELAPNDVPVRLAYADSLQSLGEVEKALEITNVPNVREVALLARKRGELLLELGETEQSVEMFELSLGLAPDDPKTLLGAAQAFLQIDAPEKSVEYAQRVLELNKTERPGYITLATALTRLGKREEAEKIRAQMPPLTTTPVSDSQYSVSFRGFASHTYRQLSQIYFENKSFVEAEKLALRSIQLEPDSIQTLLLLADLFRKTSRLKPAIVVSQRLVALHPQNPSYLHNLSVLLASTGDLAGAENALRQAALYDERGVEAYYYAQFLIPLGRWQEARTLAQQAAEKTRSVEAYLVWYDACQLLQDRQGAKQVYDALVMLAPKDPRVQELNFH